MAYSFCAGSDDLLVDLCDIPEKWPRLKKLLVIIHNDRISMGGGHRPVSFEQHATAQCRAIFLNCAVAAFCVASQHHPLTLIHPAAASLGLIEFAKERRPDGTRIPVNCFFVEQPAVDEEFNRYACLVVTASVRLLLGE